MWIRQSGGKKRLGWFLFEHVLQERMLVAYLLLSVSIPAEMGRCVGKVLRSGEVLRPGQYITAGAG